jgi:hypothetical protein
MHLPFAYELHNNKYARGIWLRGISRRRLRRRRRWRRRRRRRRRRRGGNWRWLWWPPDETKFHKSCEGSACREFHVGWIRPAIRI